MYSSRQSLLPGILGVFLVLLILVKASQSMNIRELETLQDREPAEDELNREKRFARILTCHTDQDCQGLDRLSCCVKSEVGYFRVCKALRTRGTQCNMHIQPHLWEGLRGGWTCPCEAGLDCVQTSRSSIIGRCM